MSRYGNVKTTVDGITFDSKMEARFYEFVKELRMTGKIGAFEMQVKYEIFPAYTFNGKKVRKVEYVADFVVYHHDGTEEIIDVKGVETDVFKLKRKMFEYKYQKPIKCITWSRVDGGWIELTDLKQARKERKKAKG
jgi:hypothetical protein